jgi:hypothetical protein
MKRIAIMILGLTTAALAQQPIAKQAVLREGTEVKLKFNDAISSKTAALDDPVSLTVTDPVEVDGRTVIHAGTHAVAYVSKVQHSGMLGKPGELSIRLDSLKDNGTKVHLRGTKSREGDGKVGATVALTVLFGPIGLIKHGKNIEIGAGSPLTAYVADDVTFNSPAAAEGGK